MQTVRPWLLCVLPVALYLCFAAPRLSLPGLYADEASSPLPACFMLGIRSGPVDGTFLSLGPLHLPLGRQNYHGAVEEYLVAPFIALMGNTTAALRAYSVAVGAAIVVVFYFLARQIFQTSGMGLFASSLLAIHPTFISGTRQGVASSSIVLLCFLASANWLLSWRLRRRMGDFYSGFFLMGCGIATRAFFIFAVPVLCLIAYYGDVRYWSDLLKRRPQKTIMTLVAAAAFFFVGSFPLQAYFASQWGRPLKEMIHSKPSIDNRHYLSNLRGRLENVRELVGEDYFLGWQFTHRDRPKLRFYWPAFLIAAAVAFVPVFSSMRSRYLLVATALTLLVSPVTPTKFLPQHIYIIVPMCVLLMASVVGDLAHRFPERLRACFLIGFLLTALCVDFPQVQAYVSDMKGVSANWTDRIEDLARWLDKERIRRVHILDWGMHSNLQFLMRREIEIVPLWPDSWGHIADFRKHLDDPSHLYLRYEHDEPNQKSEESRARFFSEVALLKKRLETIQSFPQSDGRNSILVFRVR